MFYHKMLGENVIFCGETSVEPILFYLDVFLIFCSISNSADEYIHENLAENTCHWFASKVNTVILISMFMNGNDGGSCLRG